MDEKREKRKKRIGRIIILLIILWIILLIVDITRTAFKESPVFCLPVARYKDGGSVDYLGVFYKVEKRVVDFEKAMNREKEGFSYSMRPWFF
ncbi:MAG: hypothetical protein R6W96_06475 [Clostridia bacterium]